MEYNVASNCLQKTSLLSRNSILLRLQWDVLEIGKTLNGLQIKIGRTNAMLISNQTAGKAPNLPSTNDRTCSAKETSCAGRTATY